MRARTAYALPAVTGVLVALFAVQAAIGFGGRDNPLFVDWLGNGLPFSAPASACCAASGRGASARSG